MDRIELERFAVADVDGDGALEIEISTHYFALAPTTDEDLGDTEDDYSQEIFARRRLTILREDLSRQLDADIHEQMLEYTPGEYVDADRIHERYELGPNGVDVSWCEVVDWVAPKIRECSARLCAAPTHRVHSSYDPSTDSYGRVEQIELRDPVEQTCDAATRP
jgi:hypothetical protein